MTKVELCENLCNAKHTERCKWNFVSVFLH